MEASILGCGWLGKKIANILVNQTFNVNGSVTNEAKKASLEKNKIVPFIIDQKTNFSDVSSFFDCDFLVVCFPPRIRSGNVADYFEQLERLVHHINGLKHLPHLIFTSSTSVYSKGKNGLCCEIDADTNHPLYKAELVINSYKGKTCILRLGGLFGPERTLVKHFAGKHKVFAKQECCNLVHLDDASNAVFHAIKEKIVGTYNIVSPDHPEKKDLYMRWIKLLGLETPDFETSEEVMYKRIDSSLYVREHNFNFFYRSPCFFTICY